jgi:hypothetical protein
MDIFNSLVDITDKHDSLYMIIIYNTTVENLIAKVKNMIKNVDAISDTYKKFYLKNRLTKFFEYFVEYDEKEILNKIFCVSEKIYSYDLTNEWKENLINYKCINVTIKYGNSFNIDWLIKYLSDNSYYHIINLKNNTLKHYHLNSTKKKLHYEHTSKNLNIETYLKDNIKLNEICIIHGVSSLLKNIEQLESKYLKIFKVDKKDNEILDEIEKIYNNINSIKLENVLSKLLDEKESKKIVFGTDIGMNIQNKMLKTLFCTPKKEIQLKKIYEPSMIIFEIIIIKSYSNNDVGRKLIDDYGGCIGITFF